MRVISVNRQRLARDGEQRIRSCPGFAIKYPFFILMMCLIIVVVGVTTVCAHAGGSVSPIQIPVVVVATFYSGMPPEQIEANITDPFERFFTLGSGIDHIESRSLTGVSLIKVYFQPGTDPDAAVSDNRQSRHGGTAPTAPGNAAASGAEVRRVQPARVPDHVEGQRLERDAAA